MFGTSGIRGPVGSEVTAALALDVGRAVASELRERRTTADGGSAAADEGAPLAVVGRDARETGPVLADAVSAGLRECGADVERLGVAATPTVARAVRATNAAVGVCVTASHNPPADNGLKLWTASGRAYDVDDAERVAARVRNDRFSFADWDGFGTETDSPDAVEHGSTSPASQARQDAVEHSSTSPRSASPRQDAVERHREALVADGRQIIGSDGLEGLDAVVDVGNGTGGVTADALTELGASVTTLNAQPDGCFPARPSEPTAEHCEALTDHVEATGADLGIAHDGDADRMMAVDDHGRFVSGDVLLALFARDAASEGDQVAVPIDTSLAVDSALAAVGASAVRTPVGDVHVANRIAEDDLPFGGEPSGAWLWRDGVPCPDGPLAAVRLAGLVAERGPLSTLVDGVETYPLERDSVETDRKDDLMEVVANRVRREYAEVTSIDGVRATVDGGWFLVRASGTEPLVRLTAEAKTPEHAESLLAAARDAVRAAESELA
ncbi:phosphopentomutase/phosphoglucosamine mutase [Halobacterium zhouii]|uniref:phosphopentomutase/phosphoglucosamine mutase n=1 Tax=Halobacterium zhouii TaxID=2902624 RepID=UPI001E2C7A0B|nr:phosphopentomutase/phosphoglucosamine mutase [Halobacterium zhouii]